MYTPYPLKNPKTHGFSLCQAVQIHLHLYAAFSFVYNGFCHFLPCNSNCIIYVISGVSEKPKKPTGFLKTHGFLQFVHNCIF